eukprot:6173726-Pleurochrysis_carterae.AAC.1
MHTLIDSHPCALTQACTRARARTRQSALSVLAPDMQLSQPQGYLAPPGHRGARTVRQHFLFERALERGRRRESKGRGKGRAQIIPQPGQAKGGQKTQSQDKAGHPLSEVGKQLQGQDRDARTT